MIFKYKEYFYKNQKKVSLLKKDIDTHLKSDYLSAEKKF